MSDNQSVNANMLALLIEMMQIESRALFPCKRNHLLGWFYQNALSQEKRGSSFYHIAKGRDKKAYDRTETFRKTLLGTYKPITPDFLGTIVNKLKIFGKGTLVTWKDFTDTFQEFLEDFIRQSAQGYVAYVLAHPHLDHDVHNQRRFYARSFAQGFFKNVLAGGELCHQHRFMIAAGTEVLFLKLQEEDLSILHKYEGLNERYPKMIHYDRELIYDRNPDCFYGGVDEAGNYTETITLLPLSEQALTNCDGMIARLCVVPANVCRPGEYNKMRLLFVRIGSSRQKIYPHLLIEIIKAMLGSFYSPNIMLGIPSDSQIHGKFITTYFANPSELEVNYYLVTRIPGRSVLKIKQNLFVITLERLITLAHYSDYEGR